MHFPQLSAIQYLAIHALFTGEKSGSELRQSLEAVGRKMSRGSFSRLMKRLADSELVDATYRVETSSGQTLRQSQYAVTDLGVILWNRARQFYAGLSVPPVDLISVPTEAAKWLDRDPKTRRRIMVRRFYRQMVGFPRRKKRR